MMVQAIEQLQFVLTNRGYIPAKDVLVGDVVACDNFHVATIRCITYATVPSVVRIRSHMLYNPLAEMYKACGMFCPDIANGGEIVCTDNALIRVSDDKYVAACEIAIKDRLLISKSSNPEIELPNDIPSLVVSAERVNGEIRVVSFITDEQDVFSVNVNNAMVSCIHTKKQEENDDYIF